jgi:poly-gamma-glutamate synthesis protein (capsule biosynthesis protein)
MTSSKLSISTLLVIFLSLLALASCQTIQTETAPTATSQPVLPTATDSPVVIQTATPLPSPTPTFTASGPGRVTLMAVGDIMLARTIGELIESEGIEAPFTFTAETLSTADITLGNLECSISDRGAPEDKKYNFRAPLSAAESLQYAGFDLVSLSNNHILDFGPPALEDTLAELAAVDIRAAGAGMDETEAYQPTFFEINGLRIAFLAFTDVSTGDYDYLAWEAGPNQPGIAWAHAEKIETGVQAAKAEADLVVVLFHNGYEIVQKVSDLQQQAAHLAIDSGADLVIGSHPHVLQRIEEYKDGLIVYSMGNFVFDNFLFPPNYSAILSVTLTAEGVESYELIDVVVQLNGVPQIMPYHFEEEG